MASKLDTYAEEQERLRENFKGAVVELEEEEGEGEEVLTLRKKTKQEEVRVCHHSVIAPTQYTWSR